MSSRRISSSARPTQTRPTVRPSSSITSYSASGKRASYSSFCAPYCARQKASFYDADPAAADRLAGFLRTRLPAAAGTHDHSATCLYTLTPDRDFAVGPLPGHDRVLVALGAAHGFKFAPLLGRALADLALHDGTEVDITPFALDRPALTTPDPRPTTWSEGTGWPP